MPMVFRRQKGIPPEIGARVAIVGSLHLAGNVAPLAFKISAVAFVFLIGLSGCAANRNLLGKEYVMEAIPGEETYFSQVWAVEDHGGLEISGRLRLRGNLRVFVPGCVGVALVNEAGMVIERKEVPYYPRNLRRKGLRGARFVARFSDMPPAGTVIRLSRENEICRGGLKRES